MAFDKELLVNLSTDESQAVLRLLEKGVTIPTQPRVLQELQQKLAQGVADVRVLARIIGQDPGMGAMLFRVVQSAAFRKYQPFGSLEHILQTVGLQQTSNLVRAIALSSAMLIAEDRITVCNIFPDQACLAGIFHDCGVPVLMQRFSTYGKDMHLDEPGSWVNLVEEDARFNADHCVVGYLVAKHWKLPDFICDAIRFHHDFSRIDDHAARTMVAILQFAIQLYSLDQGVTNAEWSQVGADVLDELGLREEFLSELVDVILDRYHRQAL